MKHIYSTGKLSTSAKQQQDSLYHQGHIYDYVIIGAGLSALSVGALLANAGKRVCLLEAHDVPGGYAHTFHMNGFDFCAQLHYIWGCAPGERIYAFLKHLGLEQEITFEKYNPAGYDHIALPDNRKVFIPCGFDKLVENIAALFPSQKSNLIKFVSILEKIYQEAGRLPRNATKWQYLRHAYKYTTIVKYRNYTLQNLFDACHLSSEIQAILSATSGNFMAPPEELSLLAFTMLFAGYNDGAYYPSQHYKKFVEGIANAITKHAGCHIFYETKVTEIVTTKEKVSQVLTADKKMFTAPNFICNMDPQQASHMIGRHKFPSASLPALSYDYSPASFIIYLGLKNIDLEQYGFGNHNIWHLSQWNMNKAWQEMRRNCFDSPWIALSTPTLHTAASGVAPKGCHILELTTTANYDWFKDLYDNDPPQYRAKKRQLSERLLDIVQERYIPNLRQYIALKVVGTPTTNEHFCLAPRGNSYGAHITPKNISASRLTATSPWKNFYWCNASSGYGGVYGTVYTGMQLYQDLTQDNFFP